ncbi:MAG: NUDIX domain-containing protein [Defluviitaleaceae bacterium]|nr:NUDIX domain-containing protein [Defluviitaleaceae bacterium]
MPEYISNMRRFIGRERLLTVGCSVVIYDGGQLLLQRRADNGRWMCASGGYLEMGETPEAAAARELFEETGLTAHSLELLGVFSGEDYFYTYENGDNVAIVDVAYFCDNFSGEPMPQPGEVAELRWFAIDDLPENMANTSRNSINKAIEFIANK